MKTCAGWGWSVACAAGFWAVGAHAQSVAYIYGDVSADGAVPSGAADAFHQMRLSDTGARGCSLFKAMVEGEGYTISEQYDGATTLDAAFLSQYDAIVFGLHQKVWSAAEAAALDAWIRAGGGILMYNDSAAGGLFSRVGTNNPTGQAAVNSLLSAYGMEVAVDQGQGTRAYTSIDDESHPLTAGQLEFEGEGVSPVAVDAGSGARVLYPLDDAYQVTTRDPLSIDARNITISDPEWAVIALHDVGEGCVVAMFDRQPVWNDGEGSDIEKRDNMEVLRRIVKYLVGDLVAPADPGFDSLVAEMRRDPADGEAYLELGYLQWSGGSGSVGVDYVANGLVFQVQTSADLAAPVWASGPQLLEAAGEPEGLGDGTEWVTLRVLPPVGERARAFARLRVLAAGADRLVVDAGNDQVVHLSGVATLEGLADGAGLVATAWSKHSGPGEVVFGDAGALQTSAGFSAPGTYGLLLTATGTGEELGDLVTVVVADPAKVVKAVNCGGGATVGVNGFSYEADGGYIGGHIDDFPGNPVAGTADDGLYNTARSGHSGYSIAAPDGGYVVYLQFAETYFTSAGKRVFDMTVEGELVLDDVDLFAEAPGKWVAKDRIVRAEVGGGALDLGFSASVNNPLVNGIVVLAE
ncbi:MAG: malectin domain-containing carbohydrate-binding protein [Verrucomicrobiota bacterium JB025]|nr:malectin domain-containing carbohydrate-binding protein [Verrucomicrobiota bacterium JB025]